MGLKVAVASSGLGHIRRGVESWAEDLAIALHRAGADVSLFQGGGSGPEAYRHTLPCFRRYERPVARVLSVTQRLGGWRYGCGSEYEIEQTTFAFSLWRKIRKHYDVLHVQDPLIALQLQALHHRGYSRPRVILANGTDEDASLLRRMRYLQHLAPCYQAQWEPTRPEGQATFAIPNFIDTNLFRPGDRSAARAAWQLPQDALIILSVAALKRHHKRCDYLIDEFATFRKFYRKPALLLLAGAHENQTAELLAYGRGVLGDSLRAFESLDRSKLPSLYQAADIFALGSLSEMLGIVNLEALASGLPITCHRTPVLEWVAGPGGVPEDISNPGGMVKQWMRLAAPDLRTATAIEARRHAEQTFSEAVVTPQIQEMYRTVCAEPAAAAVRKPSNSLAETPDWAG